MAERPAVLAAARNIAACAARVGPEASGVTVVWRGAHPLAAAVVAALTAGGRRVTERPLDERDAVWSLPAPTGPGREILVYHDPFRPAARESGASTAIRDLTAAGAACVFVDMPHGIGDQELARRLEAVYLDALAWPPVHGAGDRLAGRLEGADAVEVVGADGSVLVVRAPWRVRDDLSSARCDVPVLQLPLGEVWLVVPPDQVEGVVTVADGRRTHRLRIRSGHLAGDDEFGGALRGLGVVEIGFGLNPDAPWLAGTGLCEKAAGALHLGFGDSSLIGGDLAAADHVDLFLPTTTTAWAVRDGVRRARLRAV